MRHYPAHEYTDKNSQQVSKQFSFTQMFVVAIPVVIPFLLSLHTFPSFEVYYLYLEGGRGSVVVNALCYEPEGRVPFRWIFQMYLILRATLWP
jgi:hypothetical protein